MSAYDVRGEELASGGRQFFPDHILVPSPAAGAGAVFALDSRFYWRFRTVRFLLTTSAVVANRFVTVDYCDPEGTRWVRNPAPVVQVASVAAQEYDFTWRGLQVSGIAGAPIFTALSDVWVPPGWQLQVNVANVDVGDQLAGIRVYMDKLYSDQA